MLEALQNFFPHDSKLHLCKAIAHAAMDAESERQVMPWCLAVDNELIGILDRGIVPITRHVPHGDL